MKILVTGATGNIGRRVVDHLLQQGADDVRALTTNPEKAALPGNVDVVVGYVGQPDTLPAALHGVDRMYLAPLPETVEQVTTLAAQTGVRHIVDLSGPYESWWGDVARAVETSGVDWTHLWAGEFMENSTILAPQIRSTGQVRDPYPEAANAPIAMDDIAAVAASILLGDGHAGKAYELTGPETINRYDQVSDLGRALGRDIPCIEVSREEGIAILQPLMGEYAQWYVDARAELVDQPQAAVQTTETITGARGTTFAEWAAEHADEFH
ncbi:NAD-dependent epimerase/dehydratase family protein [Actinobacteria bacterium YIM 96077]|uniref:Hydroxylase n=1 Tax=Phytoactinopolyspora halophila TaxID=1981511 RepID=A0A329QR54_9ACTN|nr:NAD(P)H-binding protein [Phytoactinopolyspora halophila]AYY15078.1 NAD-dependent epimerase/dehydratase family protein [Actinobacteria bacterium YIM 96077]RAW14159.1 hydroxylase [Phytoactinopolyspora halophila]